MQGNAHNLHQALPTPDQAGISRSPRLRHRGLGGDPDPGRRRRAAGDAAPPPPRRASSPSPSRTAPPLASRRRSRPPGRRGSSPSSGSPADARRCIHEGTLAARLGDARRAPGRRHAATGSRCLAGIVAAALRSLGVDARVGEVPGEYCPGAWSVNAARADEARRDRPAPDHGRRARGGVARGHRLGTLVRAALEPVYAALGLDWDPRDGRERRGRGPAGRRSPTPRRR